MLKWICAGATSIALLTSAGLAKEITGGGAILKEILKGQFITFEPIKWPNSVRGTTMTIDGPGKYYAQVESGKDIPQVDLGKYGDIEDGWYAYEVQAGTDIEVKKDEILNNGRDEKEPDVNYLAISLSGSFLVSGGVIKDFEQGVEKGSEKTEDDGKEIDDSDEAKK